MANLLEIVTYPNNNLKKQSVVVKKHELKLKEFKQLIDDMKHTMKKKDGIGLAAPQIGKNIRMIIVNTKDGAICMINPQISKKSWAKDVEEEGCLSFPGYFCEVKRNKKIVCKYIDAEGKSQIANAKGLFARVLQHEIDHLDGVLLIDRKLKKKE